MLVHDYFASSFRRVTSKTDKTRARGVSVENSSSLNNTLETVSVNQMTSHDAA